MMLMMRRRMIAIINRNEAPQNISRKSFTLFLSKNLNSISLSFSSRRPETGQGDCMVGFLLRAVTK